MLNHIPFYTKWFRFQLFWSSSDTFHHNLKVDPNWPDQEHSLNAANAEVRKLLEAHIASEVGHDPELIRKATPDYPPYGKRMLRDNHWYRMLTRDNVDLVDERIDHVEPRRGDQPTARCIPATSWSSPPGSRRGGCCGRCRS